MSKFPVMFLIAMVLMPLPALAYMGPGAGITAIGCLIALLAGIWYTFKGFLWLPLKRMFKKDGEDQAAQETDKSAQSQTSEVSEGK